MLFDPREPHTPPRRVAITGAGVVTAHGSGCKANSEGFRSGRRTFSPVTLFDVSRQRVRTAAQVQLPAELPATRLSQRQLKRLDRAAKMLLIASQQALSASGWDASEPVHFVLGTTAGGMPLGESYFRQAMAEPQRLRQQPTRALFYQSQTQARMAGDALGFEGPVTLISNACASGANAIGQAWDQVRFGKADRVLTGGYDALCQLVFAGFDSLQALSPTVCRPFDAARDGLALGEGAAILALEPLDRARKRGADILCEVIGYGTSLDLHHLTQPQPEGDAALNSMKSACQSGQITPSDVSYINAHGTGTPANDGAEARAISRWANGHARKLQVSSTKASVGHLLGAAGALEALICVMCLREQWLPPQPEIEIPDPACEFQIVKEPVETQVNIAVSNSFGFGGVNATLAFRRWS